MTRLPIWIAALCLGLACSAADGDGDEANFPLTSGGPVAMDDWPAAFMEAACRSLTSCETQPAEVRFSGVESCKSLLPPAVPALLAVMQQAVKAGTVGYDPAQAGLCLKAIAVPCSFGGPEPAPCNKTFSGTLADGAACAIDEACVGAWCRKEAGQAQDCPGKCVKIPAKGEKCEWGAPCADGLACVDGACAADTANKEGDPCPNPVVCAKGLYCDYDGMDPICQPLFDEGASCGTVGVCKAGTFCKFSSNPDEDFGVCTKRAEVGGPCKHPSAPAADPMACAATLVCLSTGTADKPAWLCETPAGLGAACKSAKHCKYVDTWCKGLAAGNGTCVLLSDKDGPCDSAATDYFLGTCRPPFQCDSSSDTCVELPAKDKACLDGSCAAGLICDADLCVAPPAKDEACFIGVGPECATGLTCNFDNATCQPPVCK